MQNKLSRLLLCASWSSSDISFNLSHRSNIYLFSIPSWLKFLDHEKLWLHYFLYLRKSLGYDSYLACFIYRAKETYNGICAARGRGVGFSCFITSGSFKPMWSFSILIVYDLLNSAYFSAIISNTQSYFFPFCFLIHFFQNAFQKVRTYSKSIPRWLLPFQFSCCSLQKKEILWNSALKLRNILSERGVWCIFANFSLHVLLSICFVIIFFYVEVLEICMGFNKYNR